MGSGDTARLVWAGKEDKKINIANNAPGTKKLLNWEYVYTDYYCNIEQRGKGRDDISNLLLHGDSTEVISVLLHEGYKGNLDLIYIDPPYLSRSNYYSGVEIESKGKKYFLVREVFQDTWDSNLDNYLEHVYTILLLMKELLSYRGSIFVHLDWHASHYVKIIMDEIFSPHNFINEIIWCYGGGSGAKRYFHRKHDTILWYSLGKEYVFNPQYRPYTEKTVQRGLTKVKGDKYHLNDNGAMMQDWWTDINKILSPTARENLKFPTQKPVELLRRIIKTASLPGSIVGDFYAGSGSTLQACEDLGRKWIGCDLSPLAIQTCMYRMMRGKYGSFKVKKLQSLVEEKKDNILIVKEPEVTKNKDQDLKVKIELENYIPSSDNKNKISGEISFASLIYFWEIDPCYDGKVFCSRFQIYRDKSVFDDKVSLSCYISIPAHNSGKVAIRVYDIFGDNITVVKEIP